MLNRVPGPVYWGAVVMIVGLCAYVVFMLGWSLSPGPYIPFEDQFDYRNHRCVPVKSTPVAVPSYIPSEVWGN